MLGRLEKDVLPWLGERPIRDITAPEVLSVLRRIASRGADETARRALQYCGRVFRYAVATGRADRDPTRDLAGALVPRSVVHLPSITDPKAVGALMRAIDDYQGTFETRCALRLAPFGVHPALGAPILAKPFKIRSLEDALYHAMGNQS